MPNWGGGASGAASGAAMGSYFGPWGTAIGGGAGFLTGLFSKKKPSTPGGDKGDGMGDTDKWLQQTLQHSEAASDKGADLGAQGDEALSPVLAYFKKLMSGDPSSMLEATAPERGRVIDQYDAARRSAANFAPRGGGSGSAIAGSYVQQAQQVADVTTQAKRIATDGLMQLGPQLQALGMTADQVASADLNTIINAVLAKQGLDVQKRGQTFAMYGEIGQGVGSLLGQYLGRDKGAGGSGVAMT